MEKFNNTTLFTGYLKQFLHNYNLPKYKVYTREQRQYFERFRTEREDVFKTNTKYSKPLENSLYPDNLHYIPYIKDGAIQEYVDGEWINRGTKTNSDSFIAKYYDEGIRILNHTKNLKITNNVYDSYTHEYLGDYLRFQRDYNGINLMPLYNCFSNKPCDRLNYQWQEIITLDDSSDSDSDEYFSEPVSVTYSFNTNDSAYKIYMFPVKLFQTYTIAIDSDFPIEVCCGMYGAYQDVRDKFLTIPKLTYKKFDHCKFSKPIVYSKLGLSPAAINPNKLDITDRNAVNNCKKDFALKTFTQGLIEEISQNENCLKMFIKVPVNCTSTIVVLEGNYLNWNDRLVRLVQDEEIKNKDGSITINKKDGLIIKSNNAALNFDTLPKDIPFSLITSLQLLRFNTKEQHPFADRLIDYLIGNAIIPTDEINKNITRVQKVLIKQTQQYERPIDPKTNEPIPTYQYYYENKGFWDNYIKYNIYDYINNRNNTYDINHDVLGYVDKDVEKYYYYTDYTNPKSYSTIEKEKIKARVSISSVEVSDEEVL